MADLPPLVEVEELEHHPGFANANEDYVVWLLGQASALVRLVAETDFLDDDENVDVPDAIKTIVVTMALRGMNNPLGRSGEQLGDHSWQMSGGQATIYFTRLEKRLIRRAAGTLGVRVVDLQTETPVPLDYDRPNTNPLES